MPTNELFVPREFDGWMAALEERHMADLRFSEVTPALRALSSGYVERRGTIAERRTLDGAGKRAAFALYYGPVHFLLVHHIAGTLGARSGIRRVVDVGCGTGAAGAAWASLVDPVPQVVGLDAHPWTLGEAAFTYRAFGLRGEVRRADLSRASIPASGKGDAVIAAFLVNELADAPRQALLERFLELGKGGAQVLVVEPIAKSVSPWWPEWTRAFEAIGGKAEEWRFPVRLPPLVKRLATAAGLRQDVMKARTLFVARTRTASAPLLE